MIPGQVFLSLPSFFPSLVAKTPCFKPNQVLFLFLPGFFCVLAGFFLSLLCFAFANWFKFGFISAPDWYTGVFLIPTRSLFFPYQVLLSLSLASSKKLSSSEPPLHHRKTSAQADPLNLASSRSMDDLPTLAVC